MDVLQFQPDAPWLTALVQLTVKEDRTTEAQYGRLIRHYVEPQLRPSPAQEQLLDKVAERIVGTTVEVMLRLASGFSLYTEQPWKLLYLFERREIDSWALRYGAPADYRRAAVLAYHGMITDQLWCACHPFVAPRVYEDPLKAALCGLHTLVLRSPLLEGTMSPPYYPNVNGPFTPLSAFSNALARLAWDRVRKDFYRASNFLTTGVDIRPREPTVSFQPPADEAYRVKLDRAIDTNGDVREVLIEVDAAALTLTEIYFASLEPASAVIVGYSPPSKGSQLSGTSVPALVLDGRSVREPHINLLFFPDGSSGGMDKRRGGFEVCRDSLSLTPLARRTLELSGFIL